MRGIELNISDLISLKARITEELEGLKKEMTKQISSSTNDLFEEVKSEVPVKTGRLRDSLKQLTSEDAEGNLTGEVYIDDDACPYGKFVVTGTYKTPPNNFLRRGFDKVQSKVKEDFEKVFREYFK